MVIPLRGRHSARGVPGSGRRETGWKSEARLSGGCSGLREAGTRLQRRLGNRRDSAPGGPWPPARARRRPPDGRLQLRAVSTRVLTLDLSVKWGTGDSEGTWTRSAAPKAALAPPHWPAESTTR